MSRELSFKNRLKLRDEVLAQNLDGESILLNLETELYLGLNKSGSAILSELTSAASIEEALQSLLEQYDVEPERLRQELEGFLRELLDQGIVEFVDP